MSFSSPSSQKIVNEVSSTNTGPSNPASSVPTGFCPRLSAFPGRRYVIGCWTKLREIFRRILTPVWNYFLRTYQDPTIFANDFLRVFKYSARQEWETCLGKFKYYPFDYIFDNADSTLRAEVGNGEDRSLAVLAKTCAQLVAGVISTQFCIDDKDFCYALVFMPVNTNVIYFVLLQNVILIDFIAKYGTMIVKILITALPDGVLDFSKRGKVYRFIEMTSQLYRSLLPLPVWLIHFTTYYSSCSLGFAVFGILYVPCKIGTDSKKRLKNWWEALEVLRETTWKNSSSSSSYEVLGANAVVIDIEMDNDNDSDCAICYSDFRNPMMLTCKHMFCESCITTWFKFQGPTQHKHTCPLCCVEVVVEDLMKFRDGSTLAKYVHL